MHDTASMLADLAEAISDAPIAAVIIHKGGGRSVLSRCAKSDIARSNRTMDDEGMMEQADVAFTFPTADITREPQTGERIIHDGVSYRILRSTRDRLGVSTTLECKEAM
jgi:hypothetical protein